VPQPLRVRRALLARSTCPDSRCNKVLLHLQDGFAAELFLSSWRTWRSEHPLSWHSSEDKPLHITKCHPPEVRRRNAIAWRTYQAVYHAFPEGVDKDGIELVWGRYLLLARNATLQLGRRRRDEDYWDIDYDLLRRTWGDAVAEGARAAVEAVRDGPAWARGLRAAVSGDLLFLRLSICPGSWSRTRDALQHRSVARY
jgi:hypothetical protein